MSDWNNYNPLGSARDAFDAMDKMNKALTATEALKQSKLMEEQIRLMRKGNKEDPKSREFEALFQKYKCSCYDKQTTMSSMCKCCYGRKKVKFDEALREMKVDLYKLPRGNGLDDPVGELYWERHGLVFLDCFGSPKDANRPNQRASGEDVRCPRCNGAGVGFKCEECEDTGIPKSRRAAFLQERQSIENRYMYRN